MIKKADVILLIVLIIFGAIVTSFSFVKKDGDLVRITVDGELYGEYRLDEDQEITINHNGHTNNITIKDKTVQMTSSTCKNQICVNTGKIKMAHDKIVCLPNKVLVEIVSTGGDIDVIS